jgi:hypothetical protein
MTRATIVLIAAAALAGCSSSPTLPSGSAAITLFGPGTSLDSWTTLVVEEIHVHAESVDRPCVISGARAFGSILAQASSSSPKRAGDLGDEMGSKMEAVCMAMRGRAYGGRGRVALILRRSDEALIVDLPRLKVDETDRVHRAGEFTAAYERPLAKPEAALERGWVRAVRTASGVVEYELFLVLKPVAPGAGYESIQAVTRVETPAR